MSNACGDKWDAVTPTDDGHLIVDCAVHGEIGSVYVAESTTRWMIPGEFDAVLDLWERHLADVAA